MVSSTPSSVRVNLPEEAANTDPVLAELWNNRKDAEYDRL